jgi:hypothetical protein
MGTSGVVEKPRSNLGTPYRGKKDVTFYLNELRMARFPKAEAEIAALA